MRLTCTDARHGAGTVVTGNDRLRSLGHVRQRQWRSFARRANTVGTVDPDPAKITKKCLQKRPKSGTFAGLRLSEASEDYGTYQYFRSRTARRVSGVPRTEGGKVLPEKVN